MFARLRSERRGLDFDCSPARILSFENRYVTLSLWEQVAFLSWLKKTFLASPR